MTPVQKPLEKQQKSIGTATEFKNEGALIVEGKTRQTLKRKNVVTLVPMPSEPPRSSEKAAVIGSESSETTVPAPQEPVFAPDVTQLREAVHEVANVAGIILANWFAVRDRLPISDASAGADIDLAAQRLIGSIADLARLLEPPNLGPANPPGQAT